MPRITTLRISILYGRKPRGEQSFTSCPNPLESREVDPEQKRELIIKLDLSRKVDQRVTEKSAPTFKPTSKFDSE